MLRRLSVAVLAMGTALLLPGRSMGQSTFSSITGNVTDQSGALVPGATVQVINQGTGAVREVTTTAAGVFNVPDLDLGTYRVRVTAKGFRTFEREDIHLVADQVVNIPVQLAVGATATVLEVQAASPVISTETNDISGSMLNNELDTLPLSARHGGASGIYGYALFNTGVAGTPGNSLPVIGGARLQSGTLPTVDGIAVMAYPQGAGPVQPSLMDIQELKMETSVAPPEFAVAGTMAVVTRGGTNQFHGGAFEDYNGNALNTRNFFSATIPFRVYNNFGAKLGGPIKKNKLFFFGDYEGSREAATDVITMSVPLPAWRTGNLSSALNTGVTEGTDPCGNTVYQGAITDPSTGCVFSGNVIPSNRISSTSQKIDNYIYPQPNAGAAGKIANNFSQNYPGQTGFTVFNMVDGRVDYNVSNKDTVFGRISWRKMPLTVPGYPPLYRDQARWGKSGVLSWSHSLSAVAVNEFRFGATYNRNYYVGDVNGLSLLGQLGITGLPTPTGTEPTAPEFSITGLTAWNPDTYAIDYEDNAETTFELIDNLSWTRGKHFMKFGFDWVRDRLGGNNINSNVYGNYSFTGAYTAPGCVGAGGATVKCPGTASSAAGFADFLLGIPQTTLLAIPNPNRHIRGSTYGVFAQDEYKVSKRLTLNYGVRWELLPPYTDTHGALYTFDPATGGLVIANNGTVNPFYPKNIPITTAAKVGYPNNLLYMHWKDFNPRVGFAYKLFGDSTVIRGGYGIYENIVYQMFARSVMSGGPFSGSQTYHNSTATPGVPLTPLFQFPSPFLAAGTTATQSVNGINPHIQAPYTQQWNLSLEHQIGQWGLRASYKAMRSTDLIFLRNLNEPAPGPNTFGTPPQVYFYPLYNSITYADSGGNELYNSLEIAAEKRYGKNLTTNLGYTWAKGTTDTLDLTTYGGQLIQNQFDRAVEKTNDSLTLPNRFFAYAMYTLPVGQGEHLLPNAHGAVQQILGGWHANGMLTWQSGLWFYPTFDTYDPSNTNVFGGLPDRIGNGNLPSGQRSINHWFNAAAFKIPGCPDSTPVCTNPVDVGRFGNAAYNTLSGPPLFDLDFGLAKGFKVRENMNLTFSVNVVNLLNHPNFGQPASDISSTTTVGTISSQVAPVYGNVPTREIDFNLRFEF